MKHFKVVKKKITAICLSVVMAGSLLLVPGKMAQVEAANGTAAEVVNLAANQVGYHEKASNAYLDDFNANSGSGNYTKYARDLGVANGQAWCATFVWWLMASAAVPSSAYPSRTTVTRDWFNQRGLYRARGSYTPKAGDYVIFGNVAHCGIVESVSNGVVHTIEGNSGDKVARHQYSLNNSYILGYGIIQYNGTGTVPDSNTSSTDNPGAPYPIPTTVIRSGSRGDQVKWVQKFANDVMGAGISVDGVAGNQTVYAIKVFQQQNGLTADAMAGTQTIAKMLSAWRAKLADANKIKPVDLGTNFSASILRSDIAKPIYNAKSNVELGDDSKQADAKWLFVKQADGSYVIQSLYDGTVLDCHISGKTNGTNIMTFTLHGGDNQKWFIYDVGGAYKLVPKHASNLVMDVSDAGTTKGTNIKLWESNGSVAQRFSIVKENYNALQTIALRTGYAKEMTVGTTQTLQYSLSPENAQSNMVKWESSNERIASVDSRGVVTAKAEGTVEIKCVSTFNGNIKASVTIAVSEPKTTEITTEVTTERPTEAATEVPTEQPTEAATEVPTEQPTEAATEVPTEQPTEATTEVPTEQPTEATTEVPTEATTEVPAGDTSNKESENIVDMEFPLEEGSQFEQNGMVYEVISDDEDAPEVCLVECSKIKKSLVIPEQVQKDGIVYTVTTIEDYAFEGDCNLQTVTIGNTVEVVGEAAFMNCKNLKAVNLGTALTRIEKKAFYNCKKLRKLSIYSSDIQKIGKKAFAKTNSSIKVKIPGNKIKLYKKLLRRGGLR